jgi:hypothetical protein
MHLRRCGPPWCEVEQYRAQFGPQPVSNLWILIIVAGTVGATSIRLRWRRPRPTKPTWDSYSSWLRETRDHLMYAKTGSDEPPTTEVTIYLDPAFVCCLNNAHGLYVPSRKSSSNGRSGMDGSSCPKPKRVPRSWCNRVKACAGAQ